MTAINLKSICKRIVFKKTLFKQTSKDIQAELYGHQVIGRWAVTPTCQHWPVGEGSIDGEWYKKDSIVIL